MKLLFFSYSTILFVPLGTHIYAFRCWKIYAWHFVYLFLVFSYLSTFHVRIHISSDVLTRRVSSVCLLLLRVWTITTSTMTTSQQGNEYACGSYQNTMSRRSLFGVYSHQPNMSKYSYPSDVSLSSHYNGYTSWGLWREPGHLSPSIYSKRRINIRSFSILIMSAAFIVLLAVLSIAGLAFYFSTFKSDSIDCK